MAHAAGHPKQNRPPAQGTWWAGSILPVVLPGEGVFVLHVGLDLSRKQVEVCLISDQRELIDRFTATPDRDGLYGLARRVAVYGEPVRGVRVGPLERYSSLYRLITRSAATRRPLRQAKRQPLIEDCDLRPRDRVPMHVHVRACSGSTAQQTARPSAGLSWAAMTESTGRLVSTASNRAEPLTSVIAMPRTRASLHKTQTTASSRTCDR